MPLRPLLTVVLLSGLAGTPAAAATLAVAAGDDGLARALAAAAPGDVLELAPGLHHGPVVVDRPLTLEGRAGAVIDGGGRGSTLRITAPDVTLRGLTVRNSGDAVEGEAFDAGIFVDKSAARVLIEHNRVEDNLYGIVLHGPRDAVARGNYVANRNHPNIHVRGNGIHLWDLSGGLVEDNRIVGGRDGLYITASHGNTLRNNRMEDQRFAVHYMYANQNVVTGNLSLRNEIGYALMSSERLTVTHNVSLDDRDSGLMFHTCNRSEVSHNYVKGAGDKCAFVYVSARNRIHDNRFEGCGIGIHFTGGSELNEVWGNALIGNRNQVKYTATIHYEWSKDRRGNYWSDNPAFDLDGDGIADVAYRPNTIVNRVLWQYPLAKLLLSSPALETLRVAQGQFPALYPGGVVDSFPLIQPPPPPVALPEQGRGAAHGW